MSKHSKSLQSVFSLPGEATTFKDLTEVASQLLQTGVPKDLKSFVEKMLSSAVGHGPDDVTRFLPGDKLKRLKAGTPVFCKLAGYAEHTGIAMGDSIIHLDGSGDIVRTSPAEFLARLNGLNPAINIYYAAQGPNQPLAKRIVADRARRWLGRHVEYTVTLRFRECVNLKTGKYIP